MSHARQLVCLANSRKPDGRCIAGKSLAGGESIRPVSARPGAELTSAECRCVDGCEPALLDVIDIPLLRADPRGHQRENHLIAAGPKWSRIGKVAWEEALALADEMETLWVNGFSTTDGRNDRVPPENIGACENSLALIRISEISFITSAFRNNRRGVRAAFRYNGRSYNLKLTDSAIEAKMYERGTGEHDFRLDALLCISLTEPFIDGHCYKLVASVITEKMARPKTAYHSADEIIKTRRCC
ncbi:MAG: hypothetical protein FJW32_27395 [Acidobacteria bacterium]|nr:hypothetical protein [Acidobacteriota bacterium]